MPFDRHLIANYKTGLQTDVRQWRLMDDAFHVINNAYVWRGRVRKRFGSYYMVPGGSQLQTRLRINIGNTPGPINIPGTATNTLLQVGQIFSVGNDIFTITTLGATALTLSTNAAATATINSVAHPNTVTFTGEPAATAVYWYPSLPVMGLTQYESGGQIDNYPTFAFDPYFAYEFITNAGWQRSGSGTTPMWNGQLDTNFVNFFWATNWKGLTNNITTMFVTNFQVTNKNGAGVATDDPIWFLSQLDDGSGALTWASQTSAATNGFYFLPAGGARTDSPFVVTARIILPFRNRLILLNTIENNNSDGVGGHPGFGGGTNSWYPQRCRYSFNGSPLANNAWYEPNQVDAAGATASGAGFIDAPTDEQIITAEFIKDRLIVYFERSTWELAYTGNEQLPFIWNRLNTELGSQSTFSTVPFDKEVLTVGYTGVHACNGSNVARIDEIIPQEIFHFEISGDTAIRIAGIRDYKAEMVYWTVRYDDATSQQTFPNRVLVYNYRQPSWAYNNDTFTCFGYYEQIADLTWADIKKPWLQVNDTWNSNVTPANQLEIVAGNQEGFVVIIDSDEVSVNAPNLQITNYTNNGDGTVTLKIINHNLAIGEWIGIYNSGLTNFDVDLGTYVGIYQVDTIADANTITIALNPGQIVTGTYLGGGNAARVSKIDIQSKQWNPYDREDRDVYLQRIDFAVQKTVTGQITVDYSPSSSMISILQSGSAIMGTGILETYPYDPAYYPLEQQQRLLWHPVYFQSDGTSIQIRMYLSDKQMADPNISLSDFELEAMALYTERTRERME